MNIPNPGEFLETLGKKITAGEFEEAREYAMTLYLHARHSYEEAAAEGYREAVTDFYKTYSELAESQLKAINQAFELYRLFKTDVSKFEEEPHKGG